eukprot:365202-Chlamydomonas_euryale.AAC.17
MPVAHETKGALGLSRHMLASSSCMHLHYGVTCTTNHHVCLRPIVCDGGGKAACRDTEAGCVSWAAGGECEKNPGFMKDACPVSCDECTPAELVRTGGSLLMLGVCHMKCQPGVWWSLSMVSYRSHDWVPAVRFDMCHGAWQRHWQLDAAHRKLVGCATARHRSHVTKLSLQTSSSFRSMPKTITARHSSCRRASAM